MYITHNGCWFLLFRLSSCLNVFVIHFIQILYKLLASPWKFLIKRFQNTSFLEQYRAAQIASTFTEKISRIKQKILNADYPPRIIICVIRHFNEKCNNNNQGDYIIPPNFFDVLKPLVLLQILYFSWNETLSKCLIKEFHDCTNGSYEIRIK